ncbi:olfactory receptor 52K1-like [Oryzias latipes]
MRMESLRDNVTSDTSFIFVSGFSELGPLRLVFLIFLMLLVSLLANCLLLFVIVWGWSLHTPMCVLIACMACVDLRVPLFFFPDVLLPSRWTSLSRCLLQMFFLHFFGSCQSTLLFWMALDRYLAICRPLSYHQHMSPRRFLRLAVPLLLRNLLMVSAVVNLAASLSYCFRNVIRHCVCEHMALVELACGSTAVNSLVGLTAVLLISVLDFLLIIASYVVIFCSVLRPGRAGSRALHTCTTHIMVISVTLTSVLAAFMSYRARDRLSAPARIAVSTLYQFLPSCFNPIIYGVRTSEIRRRCGAPSTSHPSRPEARGGQLPPRGGYWTLGNGGHVPWVLVSWARRSSPHAGRGIPEPSGEARSRGSYHT